MPANDVVQLKLTKTTSNTDLLNVGELRFAVTPASDTTVRYNQIDISAVDEDVSLIINGSGYFTDVLRSNNNGTTATVTAGSTGTLYLSDGTYSLSIYNKHCISAFILGSMNTTGNYDNFACDIAQFRGMTKLTNLQLVGVNVSGDCYRALHLNTAIKTLGLADTNVIGDYAALKSELTALTSSSFPSSVTDTSLKIDVVAGNNTFIISAVGGDVVLNTSGGLHFTDSSFSINSGTTKTVAAGVAEAIYLNKTVSGTLTIQHTQFINTLVMDGNMENSSFDVSQMTNMGNLTKFSWYGNWNVYGDIGGLRGCSGLTHLNISSTLVTGDVSVFRDLTSLTYLNFSKTGIGGDIRHLAKLTSLATLITDVSGLYGTCIALRKLTNLTRFDVDSVSVYGVKYWQNMWNPTCTVNGLGANGGYTYESRESKYSAYLHTFVDDSGNILAYFDANGNLHVNGNIYSLNL